MELRSEIRKETNLFHKLAEEATQTYAPLNTKEGYLRFLSGMLEVYQNFGPALDTSSQLIGIEPRSKKVIDALFKDLEKDEREVTKESSTLASNKPEVSLGIAYTLEGSALGAKIIRQRLDDSEMKNMPKNYLLLLESQSPSRWPKTLSALGELESGHETTIETAKDVFKFVAKAMENSRNDKK